MVTLLKYVSPVVGPWINLAAAEYAKVITNDIKFMEALVKILPDVVAEVNETSQMKMADRMEITLEAIPDVDIQIEGAELRAIRQLLEKLDERQEWGKLQRVLTPEDHYLWLCEYHAQEYRR